MATEQLTVTLESAATDGALLGEREVSEMTGVRLFTLRYPWLIGAGPAYTEEHGCFRCAVADVLKW